MARLSATAALLLVLSLLAVSHCRAVAVAADHVADEPESTAAVDVSDYNDLSSNPTILPANAKAAEASATEEEEEALPSEQQRGFDRFLRLPSYHPCRLRRHPLWKPHHRVYYRDPACIKFHDHDHDHDSGHDGERHEAVSHLSMILPAEEARETEEVKPVGEPDPDRSLPDSNDRERELVASSREPWSFADADGNDVEPWKKEMLRRWLRYVYFHFHHDMLGHRLHHVHHGQEEDKDKNMVRKQRLRHADHGGEDGGDEDEEVEEMVRLFRKALMRIRRRFGHKAEAEDGRGFFHHHRHRRHAEEAEKQAAGGEEESGVMAWIKGLMNRF